ncbi:MAG TPA: acyl-CoA dehydrogenase family protein [Bryobacteraceae bacterium]|nr:acyl-CoA dehydrogenase family protein [Bryobacteraceae bacterium]
MDNFFTDNPDILWRFEHLDMEDVVASRENGYQQASQYEDAPHSYADAKAGYRSVMEMTGAICAREIAPLAAEVDREGAHFENGAVRYAAGTERAMHVLAQSGLMGMMIPRKWGGLNFPGVLYTIGIEMVSQADGSLMNMFGLQDIAETIHEFASDELKDKYLPLFTSGKATGAMTLTEPDAGSDLQSVRLKAVQQPDGGWKLFGVKRFITNGCADISLVLARSEEGSLDGRGLSMFVCEKCPELVVRRIENKLGIHGSPTCELQFNGVPGILVGQRRMGLIRYVMALMNGARVAVAAQSVGIAQAAYEEALKYAKKRIQFGKPIFEMPQVYDILVRMKNRIQASRAITYEAARLVDVRRMIEQQLETAPSPELKAKFKECSSWAAVLTPMAKAYASEMAIQVTYDAIQIHGGAGYMKEFNVERHSRDARITTIYEGTTQLQVVGASAGITSGTFGNYLMQLGERNFRPDLMRLSSLCREMRERLNACVTCLKTLNDRTYSELVSRHLVDFACDALGAHLLLNEADIDPARTLAAERFIRDAAPRMRMQAEYVTSGDKLVIENRLALV